MNKYWLIFFIVLGFLFRLWLVKLFPQPFVFDQTQYSEFALRLLQGGPVFTGRLYGYPLVIAVLYYLFGADNTFAWISFQALLDTLTAVLVFYIAQKITAQKRVARCAFFLYLFNPITSAYVGVRLAEITATFLLIAVHYIMFVFWSRKKKEYLFLLGLTLGYLPQIRPNFLPLTLIIALILVISARKIFISRPILPVCLFLVLYMLPFSYNLIRNYTDFKQLAPLTVENLFVRELYLSLYVDRITQTANSPYFYPPQVQEMYQEYSSIPWTKEKGQAIDHKYFLLGLEKIKADPSQFLTSRIKKLWYVWEKYFLFPYVEPESILLRFLIYFGNVGLLAVSLFGLVSWVKKENIAGKKQMVWFVAAVVSLFLYISFGHIFSSSEGRYSIPAYPLVFLFAGYGFWQILYSLSLWRNIKRS